MNGRNLWASRVWGNHDHVLKTKGDWNTEDYETVCIKYDHNYICTFAARHGRLDLLEQARRDGLYWNEWTCAHAAKSGRLHVLEWLRNHGCPWNSWTCLYAADGGHLHILKWARERGCHWNESVCSRAAECGHLHILKWAREHGCPWNWETPFSAASSCHYNILYWCLTNGCLSVYKHGFKYIQFTFAKKLLSYTVFINQEDVILWIETINATCDEICYDDLSNLIKTFI